MGVRRPPVPVRKRRARIDRQLAMLLPERCYRVARHLRYVADRRHLRPVAPEEPEPARAIALHAEAVLVHVGVVPPAERAEVAERRRAARAHGTTWCPS